MAFLVIILCKDADLNMFESVQQMADGPQCLHNECEAFHPEHCSVWLCVCSEAKSSFPPRMITGTIDWYKEQNVGSTPWRTEESGRT